MKDLTKFQKNVLEIVDEDGCATLEDIAFQLQTSKQAVARAVTALTAADVAYYYQIEETVCGRIKE